VRDHVPVELRQRDREGEFEAHHARIAGLVARRRAHRRDRLEDRYAEAIEEDVFSRTPFVVGAAAPLVHREGEHKGREHGVDDRIPVVSDKPIVGHPFSVFLLVGVGRRVTENR